ncbi:hypothetical protein Ahy_B02g061541 [Arachis hypogaea]|uniref:Ubiquitin-like protease family profile domain-containing protein n=1 Tax=Arachis hypogaea TaxID=3818 RepID=A0A445ALA0_ARAHY|nr:hypothetical protein Ahy_B02g061541 [Arachis hypogaea]
MTFTVDHITFSSSRKKKPTRKNLWPQKKSPASPSPEVVDLTSEHVWDSLKCRNPPKEGTGCMRLPTRVQSNYYPTENEDVLDGWQGMAMKLEQVPRTMNLAFQPQNDMNLSPVELAVAAYVFCRDLPHRLVTCGGLAIGALWLECFTIINLSDMTAWFPDSELLVDVGECIANRAALMTLILRAEVVDDVLNMVVWMLIRTSKQTQWFLPTSIVQAALEGRMLTSGTATSLRNNYMRCKVDMVTRIHQPMWCDGHWYLMIIDVSRMKLIYLDSLRDPAQAEARKIGMTRVELYLEGLMLGRSWLSGNCSTRPRFSTFDFEEPKLPQQDQKSMDCGMWVAQWMIRDHLWQDYSVQVCISLTTYVCRVRFSCVIERQQRNAYALGSRSGDEVAQRHGQRHRCQSRCSLVGGGRVAIALEKVSVLYCLHTLFGASPTTVWPFWNNLEPHLRFRFGLRTALLEVKRPIFCSQLLTWHRKWSSTSEFYNVSWLIGQVPLKPWKTYSTILYEDIMQL